MTMQTLPRWVQWSAAIAFMALPLAFCAIALIANVTYALQYGPAWVAVGVACSVNLIVLPIVAAIMGGWHFLCKVLCGAAAVFNLLTAIQLAADDRFAGMFTRQEAIAAYEDNKDALANAARELSQISETSTTKALDAQIAAQANKITNQNTLIAEHSDVTKKGPCKKTCEGYKLELNAMQDVLVKLNERMGQASKREQLEYALQQARAKRDAAPAPKKSGLAVIVNSASRGQVSENAVDMAMLTIMVLLYLIIIEIGTYTAGPAARVLMSVATTKLAARVEAAVEPVELFPAVMDARIGFTLPTAEAVVNEPVYETAGVTVREIPVVLEEVAEEPKARKRRKDGRFAKRPGPKPKLKLNDLVRPVGENVVELFPKS